MKHLKQLVLQISNWRYAFRISKDETCAKERDQANIIRLVHSVEKGLCLERPRLGFGAQKIKELMALCHAYADRFGKDAFCLKMARDALKQYVAYHQEKNYNGAIMAFLEQELKLFLDEPTDVVYGGTLKMVKQENLSFKTLEDFFASRHSVRDYQQRDVPDEEIMEAIRAAQWAPSACNRQAVRAYVLTSEKLCHLYDGNLSGIGGFAENANKFILITGKLSAYSMGEYNQHIVSAGIFSSYLLLALHSKGIGACMVQRSLHCSKQWKKIAKSCGIPKDELLVLMISVGYLKDEYSVPVSKRFPTENIAKTI